MPSDSPVAVTVTRRVNRFSVASVARSCQTFNVYSPGGTLAIEKAPLALVIAMCGVFTTTITALIVEWMLQKTRTTPGRAKRTLRVEPGG
ncbi:MAG: hypothetical protein IPJ98_22575 [Bryobacterales bacterium]|nr:hypothetical protein [Bryobacterales bacterium]